MHAPPDFIGIGAPKAGTTWLYYQLKDHPDLWLPPVKELHYFNWPRFPRLGKALVKKTLHGRHVRTALARGLQKGQLTWTYRYLLQNRTTENYQRLFPAKSSKLVGEITPSYAQMEEEQIQALAKYSPDCKLIYILRNPVDRVWSHLNMVNLVGSQSTPLAAEQVFQRLNTRTLEASHYLQNLTHWERYFGNEQIFIGFYEDLKQREEWFLAEICSFLGVSKQLPLTFGAATSRRAQNQGTYQDFPLDYQREITQRLLPEIQALHTRLQHPHTGEWLAQAEEILKVGKQP